MKKYLFLIIFTSLLFFSLTAHESVLTNNTAKTVSKGKVELGIISPLVWGVTDNVELSSNALLDVLFPNLTAKVSWLQNDKIFFASEHQLNYPTLLLDTISREGVGGILAPDNDIPQMLGFNNYIIGTFILERHSVSLKTGFLLALGSEYSDFETIDYPYFYGNSAIYHTDYVFDTIIDYKFKITEWLYALADAQILLFPNPLDSYEVRQSTKLNLVTGKLLSVLVGYQYVTGEYPYGNDFKIFPVLDFVFAIK